MLDAWNSSEYALVQTFPLTLYTISKIFASGTVLTARYEMALLCALSSFNSHYFYRRSITAVKDRTFFNVEYF